MKRPYLNDRLVEERPEGFVVIVPVDADPPVPLCCTQCDHAMRSSDDEAAYNEFGCCDRCARLWAHPRRQAWRDGWRPTKDQVVAAEADRLPLSLALSFEAGHT